MYKYMYKIEQHLLNLALIRVTYANDLLSPCINNCFACDVASSTKYYASQAKLYCTVSVHQFSSVKMRLVFFCNF